MKYTKTSLIIYIIGMVVGGSFRYGWVVSLIVIALGATAAVAYHELYIEKHIMDD